MCALPQALLRHGANIAYRPCLYQRVAQSRLGVFSNSSALTSGRMGTDICPRTFQPLSMGKAISLNAKNPWSYYELLDVASSRGNSPQAGREFEALIKAFPRHYPLYKTRLKSLTPNWGDEMYDCVAHYAGLRRRILR